MKTPYHSLPAEFGDDRTLWAEMTETARLHVADWFRAFALVAPQYVGRFVGRDLASHSLAVDRGLSDKQVIASLSNARDMGYPLPF